MSRPIYGAANGFALGCILIVAKTHRLPALGLLARIERLEVHTLDQPQIHTLLDLPHDLPLYLWV